jgi:hypothetical protein
MGAGLQWGGRRSNSRKLKMKKIIAQVKTSEPLLQNISK